MKGFFVNFLPEKKLRGDDRASAARFRNIL